MDNTSANDRTIGYYNQNADQYFHDTVSVDMQQCCDNFIKYIVPGGTIIDIGAGSGRDIKYFMDNGFKVEAIDASVKLCQLATAYTGVEVKCEKIQDWNPQRKYDGIWANASLLHLSINEITDFICRIPEYLSASGVIFISMKTGIKTGYDSIGRYFTNFSEENVYPIMVQRKEYGVVEIWMTKDKMGRSEIRWLNLILKKR